MISNSGEEYYSNPELYEDLRAPAEIASSTSKSKTPQSNLADGVSPIQHVGQTHCTSNELIVFNCTTTNGKVVSVCASKDSSYNNGYMQYHYGILGNKDTYFPKEQEPANGSFTFQTSLGAQSENVSLTVINKNYSYTMRSHLDPKGDGNAGDIVVAKSGKTLQIIPCREYPEHLSAENYKSLGVVEGY